MCGGEWLKPILVFSLGQADQKNDLKLLEMRETEVDHAGVMGHLVKTCFDLLIRCLNKVFMEMAHHTSLCII